MGFKSYALLLNFLIFFKEFYMKEQKKVCIFEIPIKDYDLLRVIADRKTEGNLSRLLRKMVQQCIKENSHLFRGK